jgi:predicted nuclease of predicted toxin-antitoxin system
MEKLYANENFPRPVVLELRRLGYDILTSQEAGRANQKVSDDNVFAYALSEQRLIITVNRKDFIKLHRENPEHFGVIICTKNPDIEVFAQCIAKILFENQGQCAGKLLRVYKPDK